MPEQLPPKLQQYLAARRQGQKDPQSEAVLRRMVELGELDPSLMSTQVDPMSGMRLPSSPQATEQYMAGAVEGAKETPSAEHFPVGGLAIGTGLPAAATAAGGALGGPAGALAGGVAGSYAARKANVALGYEEGSTSPMPQDVEDYLALGLPLLGPAAGAVGKRLQGTAAGLQEHLAGVARKIPGQAQLPEGQLMIQRIIENGITKTDDGLETISPGRIYNTFHRMLRDPKNPLKTYLSNAEITDIDKTLGTVMAEYKHMPTEKGVMRAARYAAGAGLAAGLYLQNPALAGGVFGTYMGMELLSKALMSKPGRALVRHLAASNQLLTRTGLQAITGLVRTIEAPAPQLEVED